MGMLVVVQNRPLTDNEIMDILPQIKTKINEVT